MIDLINVVKDFKNGDVSVRALQEINLHIDQGEFVAIMGPSGSGKSTLMNILGLLDIVSEGEYILNDNNIKKMSEAQFAILRNKEIGFVFQSFNLLPKLTAFRNVELPLVYSGLSKKERRERVIAALERVGLADRMDHKPNQLSGGQSQRVAIARALVTNPSFLLGDEPTGALDSKTGEMIMDLFCQLHEEGRTVILVTHDEHVASYADRVIRILDGKILSDELNLKVDTRSLSDDSRSMIEEEVRI
ncbi:ABC transporter ATP-binding protein [Culicoidibacter larvae]|uniref:ABC transporter ATP-binding protein n=1 Tax=Culicoidibacter larvae TaxID=2579976 RepID=A0A5R8QCK1_9FIRM|nr:ABC transporter ATP-binding protein [Culicoidibacter larvae]TLG74255.1 ABC transporter ATP-binding protein [Culicoidibacter larvae]